MNHNLDQVRNIKTQLRHFQAGMTTKQVAMFQAIELILTALESDLEPIEPKEIINEPVTEE